MNKIMNKTIRTHLCYMIVLIAFWRIFIPLMMLSETVMVDGVLAYPVTWWAVMTWGYYIMPFDVWQFVLGLRDYALLLVPLLVTVAAWAAVRLLFKRRPSPSHLCKGGGIA